MGEYWQQPQSDITVLDITRSGLVPYALARRDSDIHTQGNPTNGCDVGSSIGYCTGVSHPGFGFFLVARWVVRIGGFFVLRRFTEDRLDNSDLGELVDRHRHFGFHPGLNTLSAVALAMVDN